MSEFGEYSESRRLREVKSQNQMLSESNAVQRSALKESTERVAELEKLIAEIYADLKLRARFTEQPDVLDISNGILIAMKQALSEGED